MLPPPPASARRSATILRISLSDNLKLGPGAEAARGRCVGDFIIVLYNPASKARPWQLGEAFRLIARHRASSTPVIFAHAVSQTDERVDITTLRSDPPTPTCARSLL